jgi:hypothetical protein
MINLVSNQNYHYQINIGQTAQSASNAPPARQQSARSPATSGTPEAKKNEAIGPKECKTCHSRKYKDQSNDASVSFQSPTQVSPEMAAGAVATHEQEHVQHNAEKAKSEGLKATSFVQIHSAVCPECGRIYVSGGTTTTYYSQKHQSQGENGKGVLIDTEA